VFTPTGGREMAEWSRREPAIKRWLDRHGMHLLLLAYATGVWYLTCSVLSGYSYDWGLPWPVYLVLAPAVLAIAPWQIAAHSDGLLPLVLTYGAVAAYLAWRQFLGALGHPKADG